MLAFVLYWWAFLLVALPLALLKLLAIIPLGKKFYVGTPIVRYYWHRFLMENLKDFKGAGIEIDSKETINRYSQLNREKNGNGLEIAHAIDIAPGGDHEYVADVAECWNIPANKYDIFLVQFSFHMIQRDREALYHSIRILKEGGILLCNFPCMTGYFPKGLTYKEFTGYIYRWYTPAGVALYLKEMGLAEEDYELVVNGNWLSKLLYASFYIPKEIVPSFMLTKDNPAIPVLVSVRIKKPRNWKPLLQPVNEQHIAA